MPRRITTVSNASCLTLIFPNSIIQLLNSWFVGFHSVKGIYHRGRKNVLDVFRMLDVRVHVVLRESWIFSNRNGKIGKICVKSKNRYEIRVPYFLKLGTIHIVFVRPTCEFLSKINVAFVTNQSFFLSISFYVIFLIIEQFSCCNNVRCLALFVMINFQRLWQNWTFYILSGGYSYTTVYLESSQHIVGEYWSMLLLNLCS